MFAVEQDILLEMNDTDTCSVAYIDKTDLDRQVFKFLNLLCTLKSMGA